MSSSKHVRAYDDVRPIEGFPGVTRRTLQSGERLTLLRLSFSKGAVVGEHTHPYEQSGQIISGRMRFVIEGEPYELGPGDSYLIPIDLPHSLEGLEDSTLVEAFSPVHEKYAPEVR